MTINNNVYLYSMEKKEQNAVSVIMSYGIEQIKALTEQLSSAGFVPWQAQDIPAVLELAHALRIPFGTALTNVIPIKGKPTLSAALQRALATRAKVQISVVNYYEPVIHLLTAEGFIHIVTEQEFRNGNYYLVREDGVRHDDKINVVRIPAPFIPEAYVKSGYGDRVTTVSITRNGVLYEPVKYYLHEAFKAGYFAPGKEKDNWLQQTPAMMFARCSSRAVTMYASDATNGLPTAEEMADIEDVEYVEVRDTNLNIEDITIE